MASTYLIDSHCHLNYLHKEDMLDKLSHTLAHAQDQGVHRFLCISVDLDKIPEVMSIAQHFPAVKCSVGVHPCSVSDTPAYYRDKLSVWAEDEHVLALGETGLDYYHSEGLDKKLQKHFFAEHIHLASRVAKPLVVHTRAAQQDTIEVLREEGRGAATGVLHCFTETIAMARQALDLGLYISFSGIITFKNAQALRDVVKFVPLDRMLVETDSPYLAPVPYRGKPNEPAFVTEVARAIAAIKQVPYDDVCRTTTRNCVDLFRWLDVSQDL